MDKAKPLILIVEDDPLIAEDIADICQYGGFKICGTAYSAGKALIAIDDCKPDLVLLDINLNSETSGIDLAQHLIKNTNIPFIFLTSYSDQHTLEQVKPLSPLAYIVKPFSPVQIITTIEIAWDKVGKKETSTLDYPTINNKLLTPLKDREKEVVECIYKGMSTDKMAKTLYISPNTVKFHLKNIYDKFEVHSKVELLAKIRELSKN